MTEEQIRVFKEIIDDTTFPYWDRDTLKHLLVKNTTKPKYQVGNCFIISKPDYKCHGRPVIDFKAKIVDVEFSRIPKVYEYFYTLESEVIYKSDVEKFYVHKSENTLTERCEDNINILEDVN